LKYKQCWKSAAAIFLSGLILFLSVLAVSPQLHKLIHANADAASHNCAVTLFAKGQVAATVGALTLINLVLFSGDIALLSETVLLPQADYRFSSSRAPPVSASSRHV
jgi:hypothetical protein